MPTCQRCRGEMSPSSDPLGLPFLCEDCRSDIREHIELQHEDFRRLRFGGLSDEVAATILTMRERGVLARA